MPDIFKDKIARQYIVEITSLLATVADQQNRIAQKMTLLIEKIALQEIEIEKLREKTTWVN